jgi:hypothetical protein
LLVYEPRNDFGCQELPGSRIAKKACDVDENSIEELDKLLGMHLEVIQVITVALDPLGLHALPHTPLQARTLIAGKVEAAVVLEVF